MIINCQKKQSNKSKKIKTESSSSTFEKLFFPFFFFQFFLAFPNRYMDNFIGSNCDKKIKYSLLLVLGPK